MTKCDFCSCSINRNGKLVCPWDYCGMSQHEAIEILRLLAKAKEAK